MSIFDLQLWIVLSIMAMTERKNYIYEIYDYPEIFFIALSKGVYSGG